MQCSNTASARAFSVPRIAATSDEDSVTNDETNVPMLRINEKLGYQPVGTTLRWSRP